jgi:transposase
MPKKTPDKKVKQVEQLLVQGLSYRKAAEESGLHYLTVSKIAKRKKAKGTRTLPADPIEAQDAVLVEHCPKKPGLPLDSAGDTGFSQWFVAGLSYGWFPAARALLQKRG